MTLQLPRSDGPITIENFGNRERGFRDGAGVFFGMLWVRLGIDTHKTPASRERRHTRGDRGHVQPSHPGPHSINKRERWSELSARWSLRYLAATARCLPLHCYVIPGTRSCFCLSLQQKPVSDWKCSTRRRKKQCCGDGKWETSLILAPTGAHPGSLFRPDQPGGGLPQLRNEFCGLSCGLY